MGHRPFAYRRDRNQGFRLRRLAPNGIPIQRLFDLRDSNETAVCLIASPACLSACLCICFPSILEHHDDPKKHDLPLV